MHKEYAVTNNEKQLEFQVFEEDEMALLQYRFIKNDIALMHTMVPAKLESKGIASALAQFAFAYAKKHDKKVLVYCPFILIFLKRHPELREQVDASSQYH